ncbi:YciI family protein [Nocardia araoensis]|uniref:YciI family protein n=1 Tax=Nocardia araoensis TaxID=228600 RepID=UPI0005851814|nr:YciI family protein [Nocardia araoensis]
MSRYMLLLYAPDGDEAERARRWAQLPQWEELLDELREAGHLIANAALHPVETATTVRVREDDVHLVDGPFATTKEVLAGYFLIECADLDQALDIACRVPTAQYGSVEIRPVVELPAPDVDPSTLR